RLLASRQIQSIGPAIEDEGAHGLVERSLGWRVVIVYGFGAYGLKESLALQIGHKCLVVSDHCLAEFRKLIAHRLPGIEKIRPDEPHEREEAEILAAVRRSRKQDE